MAKFGFHKGWSGSPKHTGYDANDGMDLGTATRGEGGPRIGGGMEAVRVTTEVQRDGMSPAKGKRRSSSE